MQQINNEFFIKESDPVRVLNNITQYCSKCYSQLSQESGIFLNSTTYEYICNRCACCLSEELETKQECVLECEIEASLF